MTRCSFGGSSADFRVNSRGDTLAGGTGTVWTAQTGGTQITDLLNADGAPVSTITAKTSPKGMIQFSGPDDGTAVVWVDFGSGRVKIVAHDGFVGKGLTTNAGEILQGNNYDYVTTAFPNVGSHANSTVGIVTGGVYDDDDSGNIFQLAGYAENAGTRAVVGLLAEARGYHPFGANIVAYGTGTDPSAIVGTEIDFGNLSTDTAASATGLTLNLLGGNVDGGYVSDGQFVSFNANDSLSQVPVGIKFSAGTKQPIGDGTGTRITGTLTSGSASVTDVSPTTGYSDGDFIYGQGIPARTKILSGSGTSTLTLTANATTTGAIADNGALVVTNPTGTLIDTTGSIVNVGVGMLSSVFRTAALSVPVNSGKASQSFGLYMEVKGGYANTGNFVELRAGEASSTVADGIRFRVVSSNQPIASTGRAIHFGSITCATGLDLSGATFTTAGIAMGPNNITTDTTTGMKIGTATGQKIGFWNATPVAKQSLTYSRSSAGETTALAAVRTLLATLGLLTDSTTA